MKKVISRGGIAVNANPILLACGAVAGPLYIALGMLQMLIRPGYDPTRHDLSLMSNGDLGWIQITNFVMTGLLVIVGALGMKRALAGSRGGTWGPVLVAIYGLGLIGAGIFVADPALGFPPGTPADAHEISGHGILHFVTGGIGFLASLRLVSCLPVGSVLFNNTDGQSTPWLRDLSSSQLSSELLQALNWAAMSWSLLPWHSRSQW